jgi:RNA polymerase sigma factor (sigma-70 family)
MYSYGIGLGFSHDDCVDAIQDVFCRLINSKALEKVDNMRFFLLKCMKNRLLKNYRDSNANKTCYLKDENFENFEIKVSMIDGILAKERQELLKKKVESALNMLTARQREAVYLRYMQEMEYVEIGALMNLTPDSAKLSVHRAIKSIRENPSLKPIAYVTVFALLRSL